ncbi:MAG: PIN domain-containing protein [Methylomicrobium sp.]|nr:PIN domain-containing protein [Methylomicrobium sp.]
MTSVYLDSCMVIGLIEGDAEQRRTLKRYLLEKQVYSSELARMESRLLAVRQQKIEILQLYDAFFSVCEFVDLTRPVFDQATSLRAENNLKTPDALHLAAALSAGCEEFCTNDKQLFKVALMHIKVIDWECARNYSA